MARWIICAFIAGVVSIHSAFGGNTGKISGSVVDAKTRERLVGVNVTLTGSSLGCATDLQGEFFIANVPPGVHAIRVSQVGYNNLLLTDIRVRVDATTEVKIRLDEKLVEGQEVVVTAQRPLIEKDNTATRVFLESQEIASLPVNNVTQVLATLPSINVEAGVMKVRGGTMNEVAFLVDGARARNPLNQAAYTNINLSSIQEMEVITGSYNAEYGEARSGVINIITKEGGDTYSLFADLRYTPPGVKHWGPSLYDPSTTIYWENTHARHPQWWIDHPDQWVDLNGVPGNDPRAAWTPEQAYQNFLATHQPLTNYDRIPGYQAEISFGGPVPFLSEVSFYLTGKYRVEPPLMGNAFLKEGKSFDGTSKITYQMDRGTKLQFSGFYGHDEVAWGFGTQPDYGWAMSYGTDSRYAYYDFDGLPEATTDGQTLKLTRVVDNSTMYEIKFSRVFASRSTDVLPGDPIGWAASDATRDNLRAVENVVDSTGAIIGTQPVPGGYQNRVGYHTLGYFYRFNDKNTDWTLTGYYQSQVNKNWQLKTGGEFTYYNLNHFNEAKAPDRADQAIYNPYQGAVYEQNKLEFSGFIMNVGIRFDIYNPNDYVYLDPFNPMSGPTEKTKPFTQLSPRLGISHPIDEKTVLHFSYAHFFERGPFGDYGEGTTDAQALGSLTTFLITGSNPTIPWVLGNRATKPEKTVAYELGIERNFFDEFVLTVTGYYKDIRNTIRVVTIESPYGVYRTNGNGNYADVRGVEISLRKQATRASWGTVWGYANFTSQIGINGYSGDPVVLSPSGNRYAPSGDFIAHMNPILKAGLYYETPGETGFLAGLFDRVSVSFDYQASFPNDQNFGDIFVFQGQTYVRPADQNMNMRLRKDLELGGRGLKISLYAEVHNLFNNQWLNLSAFETASTADQEKFVSSGFDFVPSVDSFGTPILDLAKYRNLPRSIIFGATVEL